MKSTYKETNSINEKHNSESKNINYNNQKIAKTFSYKINKDSISKETTSSTPTYIKLQEERSCISKLSNPKTPKVIPNKVDEYFTLCIPCLESSKSIKLQVIRKLKYIFHCKHTKVINYSFSKTFQTFKHFVPIKHTPNIVLTSIRHTSVIIKKNLEKKVFIVQSSRQ